MGTSLGSASRLAMAVTDGTSPKGLYQARQTTAVAAAAIMIGRPRWGTIGVRVVT